MGNNMDRNSDSGVYWQTAGGGAGGDYGGGYGAGPARIGAQDGGGRSFGGARFAETSAGGSPGGDYGGGRGNGSRVNDAGKCGKGGLAIQAQGSFLRILLLRILAIMVLTLSLGAMLRLAFADTGSGTGSGAAGGGAVSSAESRTKVLGGVLTSTPSPYTSWT